MPTSKGHTPSDCIHEVLPNDKVSETENKRVASGDAGQWKMRRGLQRGSGGDLCGDRAVPSLVPTAVTGGNATTTGTAPTPVSRFHAVPQPQRRQPPGGTGRRTQGTFLRVHSYLRTSVLEEC